MRIDLSWANFKSSCLTTKKLVPQYLTIDKNGAEYYFIWAIEEGVQYTTSISITDPVSSSQEDFEDNYKATANAPTHPKDDDGKVYLRAESRPLGYTTVFTMRGDKTDSPQEIGSGKVMSWDFSNSDDEITAPSGYKRKRLEFQFIDGVHVKEGSFYYYNVPKGAYIDFYIVCPNGHYYIKNDGTPTQATADTPIVHYVVGHRIQGDCPMGDELNTEAASSEVPSNYKFWLEVTTPDTDSTSNGNGSLEIYRKRTQIL